MNKQEEYELFLWLRKEYGEYESEEEFYQNIAEKVADESKEKECPF